MVKPLNSNSRYAPIWDRLKKEATTNYLHGKGVVVVEMYMPSKTLRKAISRQKLEDVKFCRAFPQARLVMVEKAATGTGKFKQMIITLELNRPLTPDMFAIDEGESL